MQHATPISAYDAAIAAALPRALSMLDREPVSKTYGCGDRVFWSWKFTDFPGARFQEIAYVLSALAAEPALLSNHAADPATLIGWCKSAIAYWATLPHADGSFDEAYPYERSLAATAFTGFYVGQAFLNIREQYTPAEQVPLVEVFRKAGEWLTHNDERHGVLSNHLAAAAAALQTIAEITGDSRFIERSRYFVRRIMKRQSSEGWYEEYGGADPGYQTHTTFYLGYVWSRMKDAALLESLRRSVEYFAYFIHADGSIGGEYTSRNTRFYMPAGFEMLAGTIPQAAAIASFMRPSVAAQAAVGLAAMDAYNIFPLLNNYCFARLHARPLSEAALPFMATGVKEFPASGHLVISTSAYQAIIATSKGGAIAAYAKPTGACWSDAGVAVEFADGKKAASQGLHCSEARRIGDMSVEVMSNFTAVNQVLMSPLKFAIFRAVNTTSILCPGFSYWLKRLLVKVLVRRRQPVAARLTRRITWSDRQIAVEDEIALTGAKKIRCGWAGGRFSAVHMGSSRYFEWQELGQNLQPVALSEDQLRELNASGKLVVNRQWQV